jgi:hypothetical protein
MKRPAMKFPANTRCGGRPMQSRRSIVPTDVAAGEYLLQIEDPLRQQDERGNPFLAYAGKHVVSAYEAGHLAGMEQAAVIADRLEREKERDSEAAEFADHRQQNWNYATGARLVANAIRAAKEGV